MAVAFAATKLRPRARHVGMPMRPEISGLDRAAARARRAAGAGPGRRTSPTLIVTGGSSGAQSINRTLAAAVGALADAGVQTLHITGRGKSVHDADGKPLAAPGYRQVEYVDGMETVYAAADLLLARAGAATVCEVAAVGVPAVFVPLPIGNGEQALNAAGLVAAGGALIVDDKRLHRRLDPREHHSRCCWTRTGWPGWQPAPNSLGIRDADRRMADLVLDVALQRASEPAASKQHST